VRRHSHHARSRKTIDGVELVARSRCGKGNFFVKRGTLIERACRYARRIIPAGDEIDIKNGLCRCKVCICRRAYIAGYLSATRKTRSQGKATEEEKANMNTAIISVDGHYRYALSRRWLDNTKSGVAMFVMLNPSTADAITDDATIRRCMGFAESWGYAGIDVGNLYAYRTKNPEKLYSAPVWPVGNDNDRYLEIMAKQASVIVCAWGANAIDHHRVVRVKSLLQDFGPLYCLGLTINKHPRHPLYVPAKTKLIGYA
jgi:hypothetical protein